MEALAYSLPSSVLRSVLPFGSFDSLGVGSLLSFSHLELCELLGCIASWFSSTLSQMADVSFLCTSVGSALRSSRVMGSGPLQVSSRCPHSPRHVCGLPYSQDSCSSSEPSWASLALLSPSALALSVFAPTLFHRQRQWSFREENFPTNLNEHTQHLVHTY